MKILLVLVLAVQLVYGTDTCSLTCPEVYEQTLQLAECEDYTFRATTRKTSFGEAREECFEFGGDLLQVMFGPEGSKHHEEIRKIVEHYTASGDSQGMWVGYTDREREGTWRFTDGELYDATNRGQSAVAYWSYDQPDDSHGQDCGKIWRKYGPYELDDADCGDSHYGLCEIKTNKCLS